MPQLILNPDKAIEILLKARQYDAKVEQTDPDSGSNPTDDGSVDALESGPGDDTARELKSALHDLDDDEQQDLLALVWLGREDYGLAQWQEARRAAAKVGRAGIARYLMGIPLVSDYLEDGLSQFNQSVADYLDRH